VITPYAILRATDAPVVSELPGADGDRLRFVPRGDLAVIVGAPLRPDRDAHAFMDALCRIHDRCPCLPLRLDAPLGGADAAVRLLDAGCDRLRRLLDRVEGCDEWSIRVEPLPHSLLERKPPMSETGPEPEPGAGGRGYLEQRRRQMAADAGLAPGVCEVIAGLAQRLARVSRDTRAIPMADGAGSLALLVQRRRPVEDWFRSAAEDCPSPCALTGPWPPFSFVTLPL